MEVVVIHVLASVRTIFTFVRSELTIGEMVINVLATFWLKAAFTVVIADLDIFY